MSAIRASELLSLVERRTAPLILDVRSRAEFLRGHVPGAVHVPFWRLLLHPRIPAGPTDPIVVYCGHGPRASLAAAALRRRGFRRVACLAGHMAGWRKHGLPVVRP
jgi:rhodanese-related sulfurtransferase